MQKIAISKTHWYWLGKTPRLVRAHVNELIENADKRGAFYKKARLIKWMPSRVKIGLLRALRYNGLVFEESGRIVSSVFFQRHGNALHLFSVWVDEASRTRGIAKQSVRSFVEFALNEPKIMRCRIGAGKDPVVNAIYEGLQREPVAGTKATKDGWTKFEEKQQKAKQKE